ncbi:MAG: Vps62-related protein [Novosphingobium sp.]|uniref:Vps62-related protein n=1 Tax=Novosphingobium sp. TaxID=1874826 RepID=UPI003C7E0ACD
MDEMHAGAGVPGDRPLELYQLADLITRHAPLIYFHPEEAYFPSTFDWYLAQAVLIDGRDQSVVARHPAPQDLPTGPADPQEPDRYWLTLDRDLAGPALEPHQAPPSDPRRGNLAQAKAYVRAVHHPDIGATDLQFWMFYPYDGPGLARLRPVELGATRCDHLLSLWPGGMHEADWELAVVRIDHATLQPSAVFTSQHKDGDAHLGPQALARLEREQGRIRLYSSLYGHATYAHAEERKLFYTWKPVLLIGMELGLVDQTRPGQSWNLGDPQNHELISTSWHDPALPEPSWLQFSGRWGALDKAGGRFTRRFVDALKALLEGHMATSVLVLHVLTLGLSALLFAFAALILGGKLGTRLLGSAADNSGPLGPRWQAHKWNGTYGFTGPPAAREWRSDGHPLARSFTGLTNLACRVPVKLVSAALGLIALPFLPKT